MVQSISDLFTIIKDWLECIFDSLKVLYSVLKLLTGNTINEFSYWMPSTVFSIMSLSLILIIVFRVVSR